MKLFVWDFHGVLEEGNEFSVMEISNVILEREGFKERMSRKFVRNNYGIFWWQFFQRLLPSEEEFMHKELAQKCITRLDNFEIVSKHITPTKYSREVLQKIKDSEHDQILISNTPIESLIQFVKVVKLSEFFPDDKFFPARSRDSKFKKNKKIVLKEYLKNKKYEEIIIIGDSPWDMELKEVKGGITYLYSHPYSEHPNVDADYKITDLREILKEI